MKMTIDEIIKEMEEEYNEFLEGTGLNNPNYMKQERLNNLDCDRVCTANEMTLNLLRKYQKIEQAYSAYLETINPDILADLISTII